jgi:hypothetical protein
MDGHTFVMNAERIPKKVLNMKGKGKCQRGNLRSGRNEQSRKKETRMETGLGKMWHRRKEQRQWEETEEDVEL